MRAVIRIGTLTVLAILGVARYADAAEIRVFSTGAPAAAAKSIAAEFAEKTGNHLTFTLGQPAAIQRRLAAGEQADVILLPVRNIEALKTSGALRADSIVSLARVSVGVVVRSGAPRPDITDAAAIKKLLGDAASIVYPDPGTGGGSAGRAIARMIGAMGMTEAVKPKLTLRSAIGGGVDLVAAGKAAVRFFNISEIVPVKGIELVGPLPAELQNYIVFDAAIPASNPSPGSAASFIKALSDPMERPAWQKAGLEPVDAGLSEH